MSISEQPPHTDVALGTRQLLFVLPLVSVISAGLSAAQHPTRVRPAVPIEPIAAIIDAFHSHEIVAMTDGASAHGDEQNHAFRLSLIRDPRFAAIVNDIVVEFGSGQFQDVMDAFVRGDDVPYETLRQAWQNTSIPNPTWDAPIYEDFFRAVRAVNPSLPRERKLRVLLAGIPFNWDDGATARNRLQVFDYARYRSDLLQQQVLAKHRRALVVYGLGHLRRKYRDARCQAYDASPDWLGFAAKRAFTIFQISHDRLMSWHPEAPWVVPSLAVLRGTSMGAQADPSTFCAVGQDGSAPIHLEEQFDAVLYLGSRETFSRISADLCADPSYMKMRHDRMALFHMNDQTLTQHCAAAK